MKQYTKNRGMTLIALVVSIIISLILLSVTIVVIKNSMDNATLTSFGNEINDIQDATASYYVLKNELPKKDDKTVISKAELIDLVGTTNAASFTEELSLNGDTDVNEYYQLDLYKLESKNSTKGLEAGGTNDIYVISYPSINVYYLKGVKVKNKMYYSAINVVAFKKINDTSIDTSEVSTQVVSGMTVKKNNAKWTNKMGMSIKSKITTEEVFIELSGANVSKKINLQSDVEIKFNSLAELNALNILESAFSAQNITDFNSAVGDKQINIIKKQGGTEVGRIKVDFNNYDNGMPFGTSVILNNYENMNTLNITVSDNIGNIKSGIKEIRYDYLTKYGQNNTTLQYYPNVYNFNENYMLNTAKKVQVPENNIIDIKIPKEVKTMKLAVVDNAGNINIATYDVLSNIYINNRVTSYESNVLSFTLNINSEEGIDKVDTYYSVDGITYSNLKTTTLNTLNKFSTIDTIYENIPTDASIIYIKSIVTDRLGKVDTSIFTCGEINKTSDDYIKDGMILNYDAINNTGSGHLNMQNIWKDLSVKKTDGSLKNFIANDSNSGFRDSSLKFDGVDDTVDTGLPGATTFNADSDFTMSVMFDFNTVTAVGAADSNGEGDIGIVLGCAHYSGYGISWRTPVQGDTTNIEITSFLRVNSNRSRLVKNIVATDKKCCFTQVYSKTSNKHELYYNGILVGETTAATNDNWFDANQLGNIGINKAQIYSGSASSNFADMNVYSARIYNRALSKDEVKINYSIDRSRYGI